MWHVTMPYRHHGAGAELMCSTQKMSQGGVWLGEGLNDLERVKGPLCRRQEAGVEKGCTGETGTRFQKYLGC